MFSIVVAATLTALCGGVAGIWWAVRQLGHRINALEAANPSFIWGRYTEGPIHYVNPVPEARGWGPVVQTDPIRTAQEFGDAT